VRLGWVELLLIVASLAAAGFLFAWSGLFNIAASTGHWAVTEVALHWAMRRSVETHSAGIAAPDLSGLALQQRGAGHYQTGCAPCHGAPGAPQNAVAAAMTPAPPDLQQTVPEWEDRELFWIVRHGVKFTGMPAWPAQQRADEVWALAAFLRRLPDLDAGSYRALAFGEAVPAAGGGDAALAGLGGPVEAALTDCSRCHGRDGRGRASGAFPLIGGQQQEYLQEALEAFASGGRHSGFMEPAAARVDPAVRRQLAAHYAAREWAPPAPAEAPDPTLVAAGRALAEEGAPSRRIPACLSCHGAAALERNPGYPRLDGQPEGYLATQLRLWREGERGGGPFAPVMHKVGIALEPEDIAAAAAYFASWTGERP